MCSIVLRGSLPARRSRQTFHLVVRSSVVAEAQAGGEGGGDGGGGSAPGAWAAAGNEIRSTVKRYGFTVVTHYYINIITGLFDYHAYQLVRST